MTESVTVFLPDRYKSLPVYSFESVDSTNKVAKELASDGKNPPFLVTAHSQTAGRGRLGRSFYSPTGTGIYMSLTVGPFDSPENALFMTSAAAVAVTDAIISLTGKSPGIKWVNDIYLDGRKICGILAESRQTENGWAIIVGIGLNMTTESFPDDISGIAGSLKSDIPKEQMIARITANLLEICEKPGDASFIEVYRNRSILLGKEIFYFSDGVKKSAIAVDIDSRGGLVIRDESGEVKTLSTGEVTVRLKNRAE